MLAKRDLLRPWNWDWDVQSRAISIIDAIVNTSEHAICHKSDSPNYMLITQKTIPWETYWQHGNILLILMVERKEHWLWDGQAQVLFLPCCSPAFAVTLSLRAATSFHTPGVPHCTQPRRSWSVCCRKLWWIILWTALGLDGLWKGRFWLEYGFPQCTTCTSKR